MLGMPMVSAAQQKSLKFPTNLLQRRTVSPLVESRMGAVAWGRWPAPRFPSYRVTGGGRPPPVPTERGVRISRTTLFGS
jgi:hypothetical protein